MDSGVKANGNKDQQEPCPGASDVDAAHDNNISSSDTCDYKQDPLEVLESVRINNTLESPMSTIKCVFKDSKEEGLSFDKEELRRAEERLRVAFIEFYHKLRLLKHYR